MYIEILDKIVKAQTNVANAWWQFILQERKTFSSWWILLILVLDRQRQTLVIYVTPNQLTEDRDVARVNRNGFIFDFPKLSICKAFCFNSILVLQRGDYLNMDWKPRVAWTKRNCQFYFDFFWIIANDEIGTMEHIIDWISF